MVKKSFLKSKSKKFLLAIQHYRHVNKLISFLFQSILITFKVCCGGNINMVKMILEKGTNLEAKNTNDGQTALMGGKVKRNLIYLLELIFYLKLVKPVTLKLLKNYVKEEPMRIVVITTV